MPKTDKEPRILVVLALKRRHVVDHDASGAFAVTHYHVAHATVGSGEKRHQIIDQLASREAIGIDDCCQRRGKKIPLVHYHFVENLMDADADHVLVIEAEFFDKSLDASPSTERNEIERTNLDPLEPETSVCRFNRANRISDSIWFIEIHLHFSKMFLRWYVWGPPFVHIHRRTPKLGDDAKLHALKHLGHCPILPFFILE